MATTKPQVNIKIDYDLMPTVNKIKIEVGISRFFRKCVLQYAKEHNNENRN